MTTVDGAADAEATRALHAMVPFAEAIGMEVLANSPEEVRAGVGTVGGGLKVRERREPSARRPHPRGTGRSPATGTYRTGRLRTKATTRDKSGVADQLP